VAAPGVAAGVFVGRTALRSGQAGRPLRQKGSDEPFVLAVGPGHVPGQHSLSVDLGVEAHQVLDGEHIRELLRMSSRSGFSSRYCILMTGRGSLRSASPCRLEDDEPQLLDRPVPGTGLPDLRPTLVNASSICVRPKPSGLDPLADLDPVNVLEAPLAVGTAG
jgi:hypothetical protein